MGKLGLSAGTKLDMVARVGEEELELKTSVAKEAGGKLQVSNPMVNGRSVALEKGAPVLLTWMVQSTKFSLDGVVDGSVKQGIRTYLVITPIDEPHREERRTAERINAELDIEILTFDTDLEGKRYPNTYSGKTSDISNGGLAVYTSAPMAVGEVLDVTISRKGSKKLPLKGTVCWTRPAPKTAGYRDFAGFQFLFSNKEEAAAVARLTASLAAKQA